MYRLSDGSTAFASLSELSVVVPSASNSGVSCTARIKRCNGVAAWAVTDEWYISGTSRATLLNLRMEFDLKAARR